MNEYKVLITAPSKEEATKIALGMYKKEKIVLTSDDFDTMTIEVKEDKE